MRSLSPLLALFLVPVRAQNRVDDGFGDPASEQAQPVSTELNAPLPPFFAKLPERFGPAPDDPLEAALVEAAIQRGVLEYYPVSRTKTIDGKTYKVTVTVSNALTVDGVRINLRYDIAQKLADRLGVLLPTPAVADMAQRSATVRFPPQFGPMQADVVNGTNTSVSAMVKHSRLVDAQVQGRRGLANNEGKWFVLTKQFWTVPGGRGQSGIYGWWDDAGQPIQKDYLPHELPFADYSQVVRFMGPMATVEPEGGAPFQLPTAVLLTSPNLNLASLLSDEGVLPAARHPGVPRP